MPVVSLNESLFERIAALDGRWDAHMHTVFASEDKAISPDMTPEAIVRVAEAIGLEGVVVTDHMRRTTPWVERYHDRLREAALNSAVKIIVGAECKILPGGSIDVPPYCLTAGLWITASVHGFDGDRDHLVQALRHVIRNPQVQALGHLGNNFGRGDGKVSFDLADGELEAIGVDLARRGKLVEINVRYRLPRPRWIECFARQGVRFCLSSDSHSPQTIGKFDEIADLVAVARRASRAADATK